MQSEIQLMYYAYKMFIAMVLKQGLLLFTHAFQPHMIFSLVWKKSDVFCMRKTQISLFTNPNFKCHNSLIIFLIELLTAAIGLLNQLIKPVMTFRLFVNKSSRPVL